MRYNYQNSFIQPNIYVEIVFTNVFLLYMDDMPYLCERIEK